MKKIIASMFAMAMPLSAQIMGGGMDTGMNAMDRSGVVLNLRLLLY